MKRAAILVALVTLGEFTMTASAGPSIGSSSSEKVDEARDRYSAGVRLYAEGDYKAARVEMERAYELAPSYKLLYNIGICCHQLHDYVEAIRRLEQFLSEGAGAIDQQRREEVLAELASLHALVAHITVKANTPDTELMIDDKVMGKVKAEPFMVNPGRLKIWVTNPGYYPASKELVVESSQHFDLVMDLKPLPAPTVSLPTRVMGSRTGRVGLVIVPVLVLAASIVVLRTLRRRPSANRVDMLVPDGAVQIAEVEPTPAHVVPIVYDADAAGQAPRLPRPMILESAVKQDIGKVKPNNQDAYLLKASERLFAVADGIGGNAGGEVASAIAVHVIERWFDGPLGVGTLTHLPREAAELALSVYSANREIRRRQAVDWNISEMGTTCVAARFGRDEQRMYIAHIGDSRAYRLRRGHIEQLTTDHTMAELGLVGPRANHLSRALGSDPCPKIDLLLVEPRAGDTYLLCSDGLTKMMTVEQLTGVLQESRTASKAVASLVKLANAQGGQDNITVVVVRVTHA